MNSSTSGLQRLTTFVQRYLVSLLVAGCAVAFWWPDMLSSGAFDPFVASRPMLNWLISLTMFCIGCLLTTREINDVFRRWPAVLGGTAIQYITMPLLAFTCGHLFGLERAWLIGVIVVGCVPGAMASNVLTMVARGNVSYSVSLTTSATILSPLVVPLAFRLTLSQFVEIDPVAEGVKLLQQVVGPVVTGHLLCRLWPRAARVIQPAAPLVANGTIVWVIAVVVALNRARLGGIFHDQLAAAVALLGCLLTINVLGYLSGNVGGRVLLRVPVDMRRALTLEVGMQNAGLGTVLVLDLFKDEPAAAIPTALYTFGCMFTGTLLAQWWSYQPTPDATDGTASGLAAAGSGLAAAGGATEPAVADEAV